MAQFHVFIPDDLIWEPQPDITAHELALCIPLFTANGRLHQFYNQLPAEAQRHWRHVKPD
jgi:hypothetical protein